MVRSNSLSEGTLLRVKNDDVIEVATSMGSQQRTTACTIPGMPSIQDQDVNTNSSTLPERSTDLTLLLKRLHPDDPTVSVTAATSDVQPPQTQATTSSHEINSLQEAVASLHHAIKKININERDMKTILVDTKTVLESKLSEIDQRLDKADDVFTGVDNTTQSLVQLQMTYPWLQVKLRSPPNAPLGACCLCQRHFSQIRSFVVIPAHRNGLIVPLFLTAIIACKRLKVTNSPIVIKSVRQQKNKGKGMRS